MFSLHVLGGASIEGPDGPLAGRAAQRHRLALLALLAAIPRGGLTRDKLIAYLWPERNTERARHALSDSVYRINKAIGQEAVVAVGDELRLDPERLPSDLAAFREAFDAEDWERAVDAYAGPFLDGFHLPRAPEFERWVDGERDRLARRYASALEALAEERAAAGDLTGAVAAWRRRAAHDRYDSRVSLRLMEALEAAGNRAGALQHARIHAQLLEEEFGTGPDPQVLALADRLRTAPSGGGPVGADRADVPKGAVARTARTDPASGGEERRETAGDAEAPSRRPADGDAAAAAGGERGAAEGVRPQEDPTPSRGRRAAVFIAALGAFLLLVTALVRLTSASTADTSPPPPSSSGSASVAVLPFQNLSLDEENRFFADGVTEDILTNLSTIPELRVISRTSVMRYRGSALPIPEIAQELDVDYVLEGSIRRAGGSVRITAQLVDAEADAPVWAETYDRRLEDVFAVQSEIATRVAGALHAELAPELRERIERPPTTDRAAYNLYLRGRYYWHRRTREDLLRSAELFEEAVARDPGYARAWAGSADAHAVLAFYDYLPPEDAYPRAKAAATRAIALDETLAEAHASLGYITLYHDWDLPGAEAEFLRSIELNPSYSVGHQWYANLLVAAGRFDEAERAMSRAREVNPLSLIANGALGWVYYYAGRYEEAVRQCDLALEMDPGWDLGHLWRGLALDALGRGGEAIRSLGRAVELSGRSGITVAALAHALARADRGDEARALLDDLLESEREGRYQPSFEIAKAHLALGDAEEALRWLEHAYDERSHSMVFLRVDPQLAPLRPNPQFRSLVEKVGLETASWHR